MRQQHYSAAINQTGMGLIEVMIAALVLAVAYLVCFVVVVALNYVTQYVSCIFLFLCN